MRADVHVQWPTPGDGVARERMFETFAESWVVGLPHDRALRDGRHVDVAAAKFDLDVTLVALADGEDAAALLVLFGMSFVEDDAVAGGQSRPVRRLQRDED